MMSQTSKLASQSWRMDNALPTSAMWQSGTRTRLDDDACELLLCNPSCCMAMLCLSLLPAHVLCVRFHRLHARHQEDLVVLPCHIYLSTALPMLPCDSSLALYEHCDAQVQ